MAYIGDLFTNGNFYVNLFNLFEAYVESESIDDEIIIYGHANMNRDFDGYLVAIELFHHE